MARKKDVFKDIVIGKSNHIVVLDPNWHQMFKGNKSLKITTLENKLNKLLKEQGKVNTDYDQYKNLKKQMLAEIVDGMDEAFNKNNEAKATKLKSNEKQIRKINNKFEELEEKKSQLPGQIEAVNKALLKESLFYCYEKLVGHKDEKKKVDKELDELHERSKVLINRKEDMEEEIVRLNKFLQDIAEIDLLDQLDQYYFGEDK